MKRINYNKALDAISFGDRLPRRTKKAILGKRMSKGKLKKLLKTVKVIKGADSIYDAPIIEPYAFCPHCGCDLMIGEGNGSDYPEHCEYFSCARCHEIVGYIDNSPFIHALECEDYNPVF